MQQTETLFIFRVAAKLLKIPVLQMAKEGPLACVVMLSGPPQLLAQLMVYYAASISALSGGSLVLPSRQELTLCILAVYCYQYRSYENLTWRHFWIFATVVKLQ